MLRPVSLALIGLALALQGCTSSWSTRNPEPPGTPVADRPVPLAPEQPASPPDHPVEILQQPVSPLAAPAVGQQARLTLPASHTVGPGETLMSIAARGDIYSDPLLWPLLYRANRDQIKDPRQVYPGQILRIPRNLDAAELNEARNLARNSVPPAGPAPPSSTLPAAR